LVCVRGRFDEAVAEARRAVEVEPLSVTTNTRLGQILCRVGRDEEAIPQLRRAVELEPSNWWAHWSLAEAYLMHSVYPDSIAAMQTAIALAGPHPWNLTLLGAIYSASGKMAEAEAIYDELLARSRREYVQPFVFVWLSAVLGRTDEAFEWLERAYDERDPILAVLKHYRPLDFLRDDPRFDALFKRMGLEE
jgi:Flp pilus assembly protein TadD